MSSFLFWACMIVGMGVLVAAFLTNTQCPHCQRKFYDTSRGTWRGKTYCPFCKVWFNG